MCKTDQKTRNYIMLFCATKCPTEAEKIKYMQNGVNYQLRSGQKENN